MSKSSQLVLNCDPEYTGHREAAKRREETREWLRQRERIAHERALAAPSIVPEVPMAAARGAHARLFPVSATVSCLIGLANCGRGTT